MSKEISVQIQNGEVVVILGVKRTFLQLLNRLDESTRGIVLVNGQDFRELAPQELRRRVGMAMQMGAATRSLRSVSGAAHSEAPRDVLVDGKVSPWRSAPKSEYAFSIFATQEFPMALPESRSLDLFVRFAGAEGTPTLEESGSGSRAGNAQGEAMSRSFRSMGLERYG